MAAASLFTLTNDLPHSLRNVCVEEYGVYRVLLLEGQSERRVALGCMIVVVEISVADDCVVGQDRDY